MNIKSKLTSRKFWAAAAGFVSGLAMVFGLDEAIVSTVAGAVVSIASVIVYIRTEGQIDAAGVTTAMEHIERAAAIIGSDCNYEDEKEA